MASGAPCHPFHCCYPSLPSPKRRVSRRNLASPMRRVSRRNPATCTRRSRRTRSTTNYGRRSPWRRTRCRITRRPISATARRRPCSATTQRRFASWRRSSVATWGSCASTGSRAELRTRGRPRTVCLAGAAGLRRGCRQRCAPLDVLRAGAFPVSHRAALSRLCCVCVCV